MCSKQVVFFPEDEITDAEAALALVDPLIYQVDRVELKDGSSVKPQ